MSQISVPWQEGQCRTWVTIHLPIIWIILLLEYAIEIADPTTVNTFPATQRSGFTTVRGLDHLDVQKSHPI